MSNTVQVIPLGGLGEFGMNCTAIRFGDSILLMDAGVMFPSGGLRGLGIDLITPNITFLKEHRDQLLAVFLTHGHEDHIGGLPYILDEIPVPVYGSRLSLGFVRKRLDERGLNSKKLTSIQAGETIEIGPFTVEPLSITHSFPDSFCYAIKTPAGVIIWTGDFKVELTPTDNRHSDLGRLAEYGDEGVLLLASDSTNADVAGLSPSEHATKEPLRALFRKSEGRIFLSCFSSSIHRIQVVVDLAAEFDRFVVPLGRSMLSNITIARELGCLKIAEEQIISHAQWEEFAPEKLVFLATGTQGEPRSAMNRLAFDQYRKITIRPGDTIILSARIIPGNERTVSGMIDCFYRSGATVYDSRTSEVHSSGHGYQADLKIMLNLTRPKFFVPIHGEYRQLAKHAALAKDQGLKNDQIHILESGQVLQLDETESSLGGNVVSGYRYIDSARRKEIDLAEIKERRYMSQDGVILITLNLKKKTPFLGIPPGVACKGVLSGTAKLKLEKNLVKQINRALDTFNREELADDDKLSKLIIHRVKIFLKKETGKRPLVVPLIQRM
jgi:ribonuclease J